jgi:TRAP-type C4-dicarboxylate transport system permease small subunit
MRRAALHYLANAVGLVFGWLIVLGALIGVVASVWTIRQHHRTIQWPGDPPIWPAWLRLAAYAAVVVLGAGRMLGQVW